MVETENFPVDILDKETTVVFLIALNYPLAVHHRERHFFVRQQDEAPWVKFTNGKGFVGLNFLEVPDVPDRYSRQDVIRNVIAQMLIDRPRVMAFPKLGGEYEDEYPINGSLAELATPVKIDNEASMRAILSDAFDRCLEELNSFISAYILISHDRRIKPISRQNCRPVVPMLFQDDEGNYHSYSLFGARQSCIHTSAPNTFTDQQVWNLAVSLSRRQRQDPFSLFGDRARAAHRYYEIEGDYSSAVISAQTACEIFLNSILLAIEWEKGTLRSVTRPWFEERISFLSRVTRFLQPSLGDNWSNPPNTGISHQLNMLADIRNSVVHNGITPSENNAKFALEALAKVESFVKKRLVAKKREFPRTAVLTLGEPGLKRLNALDNWIENWLDNYASQEPDWILDFIHWRDST